MKLLLHDCALMTVARVDIDVVNYTIPFESCATADNVHNQEKSLDPLLHGGGGGRGGAENETSCLISMVHGHMFDPVCMFPLQRRNYHNY